MMRSTSTASMLRRRITLREWREKFRHCELGSHARCSTTHSIPTLSRRSARRCAYFAALTASTRDVELPAYKTLPVVGAEAYTFHAPYFTKTPQLYQPMTRRRLEGGAIVTAVAYIEGRRELNRLRRAVNDVFSTVDVLVTPTTPVLPPTVEEAVADPGTPPPGGVAPSLRNTQPFDIYGVPSISIPGGFSRGGLPIGLEISGPRLGESIVLALAHAYEQVTDWHNRMPAMN